MIKRPSDADVEASEPLSLPSTVDLWELVWRRKSLIALGIVIGLVAGSLYYARTTPVYESLAEVLVVQKRPEAVTGEQKSVSYFEDYVATHRALIVSPMIIDRAIEQSDLGQLTTFADLGPEDDLTERIAEHLEAGRGSKDLGKSADSILTLAFRGTEAIECPQVVQAVLDSYRSFLDETYRSMADDTLTLIAQARDLLSTDLKEQEDLYREFRKNSPLVSKGNDEVNPLLDRLTTIESQRSELLIRRTEFESQLKSIQNEKQAPHDRQQLLAMVSDLREKINRDSPFRSPTITLESQLFPLVQEEQELLKNHGPNHPHVVTVRARIKAAREFFALPSTAHMRASATPSAADATGTNTDPVELYLLYLRQELDRIRISEELLAELYQAEHKAAKELTQFELEDEEYSRNIARTQQLYDEVISQLREANLVKDYGGFETRVIAPPEIGEKVRPNSLLVFPGSMFAGTILGFFLALVAELTDKKFHTPQEIRAQLGLPVVGHIPRFSAAVASQRRAVSGGAMLNPMLCTVFDPCSPHAETYRALRTALYFSERGQTHRVFQVTSPTPGDGKSTLIANVAVCMAQSGKRVLLMDADLRKPRQHEFFNVSAQVGLSSVIATDEELSDAIQETGVKNLWLLPAGPLPSDPSELLTSSRFPELVSLLREQYDYVLVDTGPLLLVSDPCVVAPRVDGVLLAVRLSKNSRRQTERAKELLASLDARIVGLVVNGIGGVGSRGYHYESYGDYAGYHDSPNGEDPRRRPKRALTPAE